MNAPLTYEEYQTRKWIPGFDGIRAFCAMAVLAGHMHTDRWDWMNGNRGVTVFFVLSGFLITMLALREERMNGALSLGAFYVRRSFRIFPVYYIVLAMYCALIFGTGIRAARSDDFATSLWAYILYLQEFVVLNPNLPDPFMAQAWTLGIEEKFYLLWPLICFVMLAKHKAQRPFVTLSLIVGLSILGLADQQGIGRYVHHYLFLLIGCLLAELLHVKSSFEKLRFLGETRWLTATTIILLVMNFGWRLAIARPTTNSYDTFTYVVYKLVFGVATFFFLGSIVLRSTSRLHRFLSLKPLILVGQLSYSIYLVHRLGIGVAEKLLPFGHETWWGSTIHLLVVSAGSIAFSYGMWIVIEKPCIAIGRRWSDRNLASQRAEEAEFSGVAVRSST